VYVACDVSCEVFWGFRTRGMRFASCTKIPEVRPRKLVAKGCRGRSRRRGRAPRSVRVRPGARNSSGGVFLQGGRRFFEVTAGFSRQERLALRRCDVSARFTRSETRGKGFRGWFSAFWKQFPTGRAVFTVRAIPLVDEPMGGFHTQLGGDP